MARGLPAPRPAAAQGRIPGHEEVKALWSQFRSAWDELTIDLEDVIHVDSEQAIARARFRGRGAGSGAEVDRVVFYAFRFRDEQLVYCHAFDDEASARADLGLEDG
jgi:ketosteroid isomerase-like protein